MLQLDNLRGGTSQDYTTSGAQGAPGSGSIFPPSGQNPFLPLPLTEGTSSNNLPSTHGLGPMIHWSSFSHQPPQQQQQQHQQLQEQRLQDEQKRNEHNSDDEDDEYRPFTPPPPRERLSYTRYQLELLNGIYQEVRYPNSTQKQLIAKRVGITREQVKIWFQNRRRKDVVTKTGKPELKGADASQSPASCASGENSNHMAEDSAGSTGPDGEDKSDTQLYGTLDTANSLNNHGKSDSIDPSKTSGTSGTSNTSSGSDCNQHSMVSPVVLRSMIAELNKFDNEYLKQKKNKKKSKKKRPAPPASTLPSSLPACKSQRLFQSYDMVAPPNKVTPTAFLNTSANRFSHSSGTSAFHNPRNPSRATTTTTGSTSQTFPSVEGLDMPRSSLDVPVPSLFPSHPPSLFPSHPNLYDNLPVLSDLLNSYKTHHPTSSMAAVHRHLDLMNSPSQGQGHTPNLAAMQRQLEQSIASSQAPGHNGMTSNIQNAMQKQFDLMTSSHVQSLPPPPPPPRMSSTGLSSLSGSSVTSPSGSSISGDSSRSPNTEFPYPPSPSYPSAFSLNRMYPFPLVADPPLVLSNLRPGDRPSWSSSIGGPGSPHMTPNEPYRPLMISSLSNPYFSPPASTFTLSDTPLAPWPSSPPGDPNSNFTQL